MSVQKTSILSSYNKRHILLTGATGFLGKVLLAMMLQQITTISCIYVLLRKNKKQSAMERLTQDILSSPVFQQLDQEKKAELTHFLVQRVKVIEGDITLTNLGISEDVAIHLYEKMDLVINIAGLIDFYSDIRDALNINVHGALHVAEFVKRCRSARLIHISTCYVAGNQSGSFQEKVQLETAPNGLAFDPELELATVVRDIESLTATEGAQQRFKTYGQERASHWGWSNTYCYSKALAELLLVKRFADIPVTIIRPAIIESAISFPFPGWNEGINGTAPLTMIIGGWYPYMVVKKNNILDIVPVDLVSNAILVIGAEVLNKSSSRIYQLSSSSTNPFDARRYVQNTRKWHGRRYRKEAGTPWVVRYLRTLKPIRFISPDSKRAPQKLSQYAIAMSAYLRKKGLHNINDKVFKMRMTLYRIDKTYSVFQPFTYDHQYVFLSNQIGQLFFAENHFNEAIHKIDWDEYLSTIHLPGLDRWVFPLFEKKKVHGSGSPWVLNENEKQALLDLTQGI